MEPTNGELTAQIKEAVASAMALRSASEATAQIAKDTAAVLERAASRQFKLAVTTAICGLLTALGVGYMSLKQAEINQSQKEATHSITELAQNTNSIKDALVKTTGEKAALEGNIQGRRELKAEQRRGVQ